MDKKEIIDDMEKADKEKKANGRSLWTNIKDSVISGFGLDDKVNPGYDSERYTAQALGFPMSDTDTRRDIASWLGEAAMIEAITHSLVPLIGKGIAKVTIPYNSKADKVFKKMYTHLDPKSKSQKIDFSGADTGNKITASKLNKLHPEIENFENGKALEKVAEVTGNTAGTFGDLSIMVKAISDTANKKKMDKVNDYKSEIDPYLAKQYLQAYLQNGQDHNKGNSKYYSFAGKARKLIKDFDESGDAELFINNLLSDSFQNALEGVNNKEDILQDYWESQKTDVEKWYDSHFNNSFKSTKKKDLFGPGMGMGSIKIEVKDKGEPKVDINKFRGYAPNTNFTDFVGEDE